MIHRYTVGAFAAGAALLSLSAVSLGATAGAELYRSELSSGAGWGINANSADFSATFGYDYSADFIPEAPNSQGGDDATTGVKLEANLADGALSVFHIYPVGESFTGNYMLRFDAWTNYDADERVNGGSAGTTEFIGGGIGYNSTNADVGVGAEGLATGDGGSGSDSRTFADGAFLSAAEMAAGDRNGFNAHYSDFLPGVVPPAGQAQGGAPTPAGIAGSPGFQWVTFEISVLDGVIDWYIEKPGGDRLLIASWNTIDRPTTTDGNIGLIYADFFSSVTASPDLTFGVVDNVQVNVAIPTPAALPAGLLALGVLTTRRRRR